MGADAPQTVGDVVLEGIQCSIGLISEGHLDKAQELLAALYWNIATAMASGQPVNGEQK